MHNLHHSVFVSFYQFKFIYQIILYKRKSTAATKTEIKKHL